MKREIKIANSNLLLRFYESDEDGFVSIDKFSRLKYRIVFQESGLIKYLNGKERFFLGNSFCWVIEKSTKKFGGALYTISEAKYIARTIKSLPSNYSKSVFELLSRAIGLSEEFYSSYSISDFKDTIYRFIEQERINPKITKMQEPMYSNNRYSVYRLLLDLEKDKSAVWMDSNLIGKADNVKSSIIKQDISIFDEQHLEDWNRLEEIKGDLKRANLSISIKAPVKVSIPDNKFGVKKETLELTGIKDYCIIKDGKLNQRYVAVCVSPALSRKLKNSGVISSDLMWKNSYLLDLEKLPIISCRDLSYKLTNKAIGSLEIKKIRCKVAIIYFKLKNKKPIKIDKKTKYIRSLGIYGDSFRDVSSTVIEDREVPEVVFSLGVRESNLVSENLINNYLKGFAVKDSLKSFLNFIEKSNKTEDDFEEELITIDKKLSNQYFLHIMSKDLEYEEKRNSQKPYRRVEFGKLGPTSVIVGNFRFYCYWNRILEFNDNY